MTLFWIVLAAGLLWWTALIILALKWMHAADEAGERFDQVMADHYHRDRP